MNTDNDNNAPLVKPRQAVSDLSDSSVVNPLPLPIAGATEGSSS
jgi:hypothetical protein